VVADRADRPDQLRQRVAFALSEIMVISTNSITPTRSSPYQNMLAKDAFGNFSTVMKDVALSTGMGAYLNMLDSNKPGNGQIANENFARENMQLFTIGLNMLNQDGTPQLDASGNMIPTYTEAQVQAFARALHRLDLRDRNGRRSDQVPEHDAELRLAHGCARQRPRHDGEDSAQRHHAAGKSDSGSRPERRLANIFAHPNVGPFICRQLIQHLVSSIPAPPMSTEPLRYSPNNGNGVRGDMGAVVAPFLKTRKPGQRIPIRTSTAATCASRCFISPMSSARWASSIPIPTATMAI
jgi:uncharacterized protein (DUF1800 family)